VRTLAFLLLATLPALAAAAPPAALERDGNVYYQAGDGSLRQITRDGGYGAPILSPDGRTIAFVREDRKPDSSDQGGLTSLWIADVATGAARKLLAGRPDDDPKRDLAWFRDPVFSLDGGFVYVEAQAWATSGAIHQIDVATGRERFVVDGWLYGVLRNGRYRGHLVVGQHKYHGAPNYGSYNPVSVFRPDGTKVLTVPGSELDDGTESLPRWLKAKGWTVS
jgi:dipeptidyl aminopeptidase/acylaminoacyl peptidase